jgi:hypothetical protein
MALNRSIRWRSLQHGGLEQLVIHEWSHAIIAVSAVIGSARTTDFGLLYQVNLLPGWTEPALQVQQTDGVILTLSTDGRGRGRWRDSQGEQGDLADCIDIDFEATPFTNTLPLRRKPLAICETQRFVVAYVPIDTLEPVPTQQVYTRLTTDRYRFELADGSFSAELTVDADGLVVHYPGLFERVETQ